jgi:putative SOS response-associated peptidase YedK
MCGRVRLSTDYSATKIKVKFDPSYPAPNIPASWNVCPTDPMLVAVRSEDGKRIPQQMRWGLVPWWAKDIKVGFSSINARAETVDTAPAFRDAWKKVNAASSSLMDSTNGRSHRSSLTPSRWRMAARW